LRLDNSLLKHRYTLVKITVGFVFFILYLVFSIVHAFSVPTVRIKDICYIEGIRKNQLVGVGLVTGLPGKGDSSRSFVLKESIANFLNRFGFKVSPDEIRSKNSAVVMITAEVPAFARPGDRIDVIVSSIADAKNLDGGVLLQAPLRGANGKLYAVAQGVIEVEGKQKTVGRIPKGAIVEQKIISDFFRNGNLSILLKNPNFITANVVADAIRKKLPKLKVVTRDSSIIDITVPPELQGDIVKLIASIESIEVKPDSSNTVVIDSKTGVIIMGENVRIGKVAVAYKSVQINVGFYQQFGEENANQPFVIKDTVSVDDFVNTLKAIGLKSDAIISILKAIDKAGALYGELKIM